VQREALPFAVGIPTAELIEHRGHGETDDGTNAVMIAAIAGASLARSICRLGSSKRPVSVRTGSARVDLLFLVGLGVSGIGAAKEYDDELMPMIGSELWFGNGYCRGTRRAHNLPLRAREDA